MGTTTTTTGSNTSNLQFNPIAQGVYNNLITGGGSALGGYINNPFGNAAYQMGASQTAKGAQTAGNTNMQALLQNMKAQGLGGQAGQGWLAAQQSNTGRANQAMSASGNVQNVLAALQRQMAAAGTGLSFSPQLTGQSGNFTQQQQTGGLGTWLPQLLGAGLGAATMGLTGGASGMAGALKMPSYMPGGGAAGSAFPGMASTGMTGAIPGLQMDPSMLGLGMSGGGFPTMGSSSWGY